MSREQVKKVARVALWATFAAAAAGWTLYLLIIFSAEYYGAGAGMEYLSSQLEPAPGFRLSLLLFSGLNALAAIGNIWLVVERRMLRFLSLLLFTPLCGFALFAAAAIFDISYPDEAATIEEPSGKRLILGVNDFSFDTYQLYEPVWFGLAWKPRSEVLICTQLDNCIVKARAQLGWPDADHVKQR